MNVYGWSCFFLVSGQCYGLASSLMLGLRLERHGEQGRSPESNTQKQRAKRSNGKQTEKDTERRRNIENDVETLRITECEPETDGDKRRARRSNGEQRRTNRRPTEKHGDAKSMSWLAAAEEANGEPEKQAETRRRSTVLARVWV